MRINNERAFYITYDLNCKIYKKEKVISIS